ncbi:16S rRNA (cytosine(1402)-N(4))-methyltransferase [bacterium]|nr:MAG: 16S rRNA (cytosine(1402)-N(4))-methyltransferase [bacterium]
MTRHVPVMLEETLRFLEPGPGKRIVDLTLGGGGHSEALLQAGAEVIAFDRDAVALQRATDRLSPHSENFIGVHREFGALAAVLDELGFGQVDGVLMDLGLSSDQLDDPGRGFAFRFDGPLDLRFDTSRGVPAAELLAHEDVGTIERWLREYGELRSARGVAREISARARQGTMTTTELRQIVAARLPGHVKPEPELARLFQALRIAVNDELGQLETILECLPDRLHAGGVFVAISYHSLEDRRVKRMLRRLSGRVDRGSRHLPAPDLDPATFEDLTPKVLRPTDEEVARNPRARSARLRAGRRL